MDTRSNRSHHLLLGTEVNGAHRKKKMDVLLELVNLLVPAWVEKKMPKIKPRASR